MPAYVANRPLRYLDPSGMIPIPFQDDWVDDIKDWLDDAEEWLDGIGDWVDGMPIDDTIVDPIENIGDDIIGVGSEQVDTLVDLLLEMGKDDSPCKQWLAHSLKCTLCSVAKCTNGCCSQIAPPTWDMDWYGHNYTECLDKVLDGKPTHVVINTKKGFWHFASKLEEKCKAGPSKSKCCEKNKNGNAPPFVQTPDAQCHPDCVKLRKGCDSKIPVQPFQDGGSVNGPIMLP